MRLRLARAGGIGEMRGMSRTAAFFIIALLWAAMWLPGLGSTEIRDGEARSILPAVAMLESGDWLVPQLNGRPSLAKPPLASWAVALSFQWLGRRDEWAARLPSALCVLALCGVMIAVSAPRTRSMLTPEVAFIASVFLLTTAGLLAKARFAGAEGAGIHAPLAGMGIVLWMAWWQQGRSPWLTWTVPFAPLGLAALADMPLHLVFFYAIVLAVLWHAKECRLLAHPAHFAGLLIAGAICAAWAVQLFRAVPEAGRVWWEQVAGRSDNYAMNIPRGLFDLLPWVVFAPVLRECIDAWEGRERALVRGAAIAGTACFFIVLLIPAMRPPDVLPLAAPLAVLFALAVGDEALAPPSDALRRWWRTNSGVALGLIAIACVAPALVVLGEKQRVNVGGERFGGPATLLIWPLLASACAIVIGLVVFIGRLRLARPTRIAGASAALAGAASMLYAGSAVPFIHRAERFRPLAAEIDSAIPSGARVVIFDAGDQPTLFYVRSRYTLARAIRDIPADTDWIITRREHVAELQWEHAGLIVSRDFPCGKDDHLVLMKWERHRWI